MLRTALSRKSRARYLRSRTTAAEISAALEQGPVNEAQCVEDGDAGFKMRPETFVRFGSGTRQGSS